MEYPDVDFERDDRGRAIARNARIGDGVHLAHNVTIYPEVCIGKGSVVMENSVLGRVPIGTRSSTRPVAGNYRQLTIGDRCVIGPNSVIYTDCRIGADCLIAEMASVREGTSIGDGSILGRGVKALYNCTIGKRVRVHDLTHLVGDMVIEDDVFIGIGISMANDPDVYLSRFQLAPLRLRPPTIRKYAVIASGATLNPAVEIGIGAMVGTGSVVTRDVPPWTIVAGVPARHLRDVPDEWRRKVLQYAEAHA